MPDLATTGLAMLVFDITMPRLATASTASSGVLIYTGVPPPVLHRYHCCFRLLCVHRVQPSQGDERTTTGNLRPLVEPFNRAKLTTRAEYSGRPLHHPMELVKNI